MDAEANVFTCAMVLSVSLREHAGWYSWKWSTSTWLKRGKLYKFLTPRANFEKVVVELQCSLL